MHHIKYTVLFLLSLIFLQACKEDKKRTTPAKLVQATTAKTPIPSSSVVINVVSDDKKVLNYLSFVNDSYIIGENHHELDKEKIGGTSRITLHNINQPQIMTFYGFGNKNYYTTRFLVSPNDTIKMVIKNGKISFNGKRADNYNFFYELDPEDRQYGRNGYTNALDYKNSTQSIYLQRKQFYLFSRKTPIPLGRGCKAILVH